MNNQNSINLIEELANRNSLSAEGLLTLLEDHSIETRQALQKSADALRRQHYGNRIFIRGLIEFTNYCKNDCFYCGIRKSNSAVSRYRLQEEDILTCCQEGYKLGFRTFVLQGGEDPYFTDEKVCHIVATIRSAYPDCAITLSIGEKSKTSYEAFRRAGANRYLLRHESANDLHYSMLHPPQMHLQSRIQCLYNLKEAGFQTGCGIMVGSPYQTREHLVEDLLFIKKFEPEMVGIGPFLPASGTPFADKEPGSVEQTLKLLSLMRLLLPKVLLPATTALGTAEKDGREQGILAGANVIMPNLSPLPVRKKYLLYDGKLATGDESAEGLCHLKESMKKIGFEVVTDRGDYSK